MPTPSQEALLDELEIVSHGERRRRLVELGRRSRTDSEAENLIAELGESPSAYQRQLALFTAAGSGDGSRVSAALSDPSRTVRRQVRLLGVLGGDEAYGELLGHTQPDHPLQVRLAVLRALWDHLDDRRAWETFAARAEAADGSLAVEVAEVALRRVDGNTDPRMAALLGRLLARPDIELRRLLQNHAAKVAEKLAAAVQEGPQPAGPAGAQWIKT